MPGLPGHAGSSWAGGRRRGARRPRDSAAAPLLRGTGHHCLSQLAWPSCCSHQSCPNSLSVLCSTGKPQQLLRTRVPAGSVSLHHRRRLTLSMRAILQTDLLFPAWVAAPQRLPSLSTTTILVNQRCSLLPWFDSKFSHFLLDRVRVTHTQPTPRASCTATGCLMRKGTCPCIPQKGTNCLTPWQHKDSVCSQGC